MTAASTLTAGPRSVSADSAACSPAVIGVVLDVSRAESLARVFKALGDPTRVRLVSLIAAHAGAEACVCDLTEPVGLSQPTVSHHLKQLVDAGLLSREPRALVLLPRHRAGFGRPCRCYHPARLHTEGVLND